MQLPWSYRAQIWRRYDLYQVIGHSTVHRSPTGLRSDPIGLRRTTDRIRQTSDTILGLILTILGLNAFIWSPSRTSTPIGLRWYPRLNCRLNNLKSPTGLRPNFLGLRSDFVKISESDRWIIESGKSWESLILTSEAHRTCHNFTGLLTSFSKRSRKLDVR